MYVPVTCAGMLQRLPDAGKHRVRLIVDMRMGTIANSYGVITLFFAASSSTRVNTTAGKVQGIQQQYLAHTCTAQPVAQAIVNSEKEENVKACFEDLVWLCQQVGGST